MVGPLTFSPVDAQTWCRPHGAYVIKGRQDLTRYGSHVDRAPFVSVFGQFLAQECDAMRSLSYTIEHGPQSTISDGFGVRAEGFARTSFDAAMAKIPDETVFDCDRLAAHAGDPEKPRGASGVGDAAIDIAATTTACGRDLAANPSIGRFHFQLGRAFLMDGAFDRAADAFQAGMARGHGMSFLYLATLQMNGWGVPYSDDGSGRNLYLAGLRGAETDYFAIERAVAQATGEHYRTAAERRCASARTPNCRKYITKTPNTSDREYAQLETLFRDIPEDDRAVFIYFYAGDFDGLEYVKQQTRNRLVEAEVRSRGENFALLLAGGPARADQIIAESRFQPILAQYALIKVNRVGLCGAPPGRIAVTTAVYDRWVNLYGVEVSRSLRETYTRTFEVAADFAPFVSMTNTTGEWRHLAPGVRAMIDRHGGCGGDVLDQLERNMLAYATR